MSEHWRPTTAFEEEIVALQPEHHFIYGSLAHYPRPQEHLDYANVQRQDAQMKTTKENQKLNMIKKVQRIACTKRLGEQCLINDWDTTENVERETIAMMRHLGLGPSVEKPLEDRTTIATQPIETGMRVVHSGFKRFPILFDENYFKLKPRLASSAGDTSQASTDSSCQENSFNTPRRDGKKRDSDSNISYKKLIESPSPSGVSNYYGNQNNTMDSSSYLHYVPSRSWYRSNTRGNRNGRGGSIVRRGQNGQVGQSFRGGQRGRGMQTVATSYDVSNNAAKEECSREPRRQRWYTAREIYEKKRFQCPE